MLILGFARIIGAVGMVVTARWLCGRYRVRGMLVRAPLQPLPLHPAVKLLPGVKQGSNCGEEGNSPPCKAMAQDGTSLVECSPTLVTSVGLNFLFQWKVTLPSWWHACWNYYSLNFWLERQYAENCPLGLTVISIIGIAIGNFFLRMVVANHRDMK